MYLQMMITLIIFVIIYLKKIKPFLFLVIHSNPPSGGLGEMMIAYVSVGNIIEWGPSFLSKRRGGAILYLSVALCFMI